MSVGVQATVSSWAIHPDLYVYGGIFSQSLLRPDGASCYVGNMSNIAVACEPVSPSAKTPLALWHKEMFVDAYASFTISGTW
jgi:hypothetical protein